MIGRLEEWYRANVSARADCLACRLTSGCGLLGIGAYLLAQSNRPRPMEALTMKSLAAIVGLLGVARLADAKFLKPDPRQKASPSDSGLER